MTENVLLEQKEAVSLFFESLLREVPVEDEAVPPLLAVTPMVEPASQPVPEPQTEVDQGLVQDGSTEPDWTQAPFEALMFTVAGLRLAVPFIELEGVVEVSEVISEIAGNADFYMGGYLHQGRTIPVVDTAHLVLPAERRADLLEHDAYPHTSHIILIDKGNYALACEAVEMVLALDPTQVKWRSSQTKREWLRGTVLEHRCALLDTRSIAAMIRQRQ